MKTTSDNIRLNKAARRAVEILERYGLQVTVSQPGCSPKFLVQDSRETVLNWCPTSTVSEFANGVEYTATHFAAMKYAEHQKAMALSTHRQFIVASVSTNTNSFGLTGVVLVARNGEAFEAATNTTGPFALKAGDMVALPIVCDNNSIMGPGRYQWVSSTGRTFEIPRRLDDCPRQVVGQLFADK